MAIERSAHDSATSETKAALTPGASNASTGDGMRGALRGLDFAAQERALVPRENA